MKSLQLNDPILMQYLRLPLLVFVVVIAVFGAANYFIDKVDSDINYREQMQSRELDSVLKQVLFLQRQEQLFHQYGEKYRRFLQEGLVHQQDRVKWTDELLKIKQLLVMTPFSIQFEPEKKLTKKDVKYLVIEKDIFYYTNLNVSAGLQTDLDILSLFDQISKNITPLYLVKKCKLKANREELNRAEFSPKKAVIDANCTMVLFQAKPREFASEVQK